MLVTSDNMGLFEKAVSKYNKFSILPHYNPDPDALGSAFGLQYILTKYFKKEAVIYYEGVIGRAENKTMVNVLDIPLVEITDRNEHLDGAVVLMDTQPGSGNNPLVKNHKAAMVFDHHPLKSRTSSIDYADIRLDYGSTSTIIYDYIRFLDLKPTVNIATALFYGIQTDVVGEGRKGNKVDFIALESLSRYINRNKLYSIENPKLSFDYYVHINKGLKNSILYDNLIITSLGDISNPDYVGEIADFLIRFDRVDYVLVVGTTEKVIQVSFRSQSRKTDAGLVLKQIVGTLGTAGGHPSNAGGRILYRDNEDANKIIKKIITRTLDSIHGKIMTGIPLLSLGDYLKL